MKAPPAGGMGEQGHDESVPDASQPVHTAPQKRNIPEVIKSSQWLWSKLLFSQQKGWVYTTMIGDGPKQDRLMPYPLNTDEEDGDPVLFRDDMNAYCGVTLREQKHDLTTTKPTDLLWLDMDAKERHDAPEGEDLTQMPAHELKALVAAQYHAFMEKCRVLGLSPVAVVYSGHGLQAYFRVGRVLETEETEAANRALAKRFAEFGADPKVYNVGRLLRMPNTYNVKNPERPIETELWQQGEAILSDELLSQLLDEGRAVRAPGDNEAAPEQKPKLSKGDGSGLIDWYNDRTPLGSYLLGRGYEDEGDGRMSSPYSETGRDVRLLANKKGVQCAYLHSSSHPMAQWLGLDGEVLSNHLIDPFEFFVYYEYSDDGKVPYEEARNAALRSLATELGAELIAQTLEEQPEQVVLPDANAIPAPLRPNKDKLDYSDAQAVSLLGLPDYLSTPDDDLASAARLVAEAEDDLCYVPEKGFLAYVAEAHIWVQGDTARQQCLKYAASLPQVVTKEVSFLLACALACQRAGHDQKYAALIRLAQRMEMLKGKKGLGSRAWRERAVADASTLLLTSNERFHARPFLLGFPKNVYDNGTVREHRREDGFTELLPVEYDPQADQSDWLSVLGRMTGGDQAFQRNLQYLAGYALSGQSTQKVVFFLYGPKGTGKSTFAETLRAVLGKQAAVIDPKYLSVKADRERLGAVVYNKRLALCNEVGGTRLQAEILKTLGGGDGLTVRKLYQDAFDADPTHALVMISNDPPNVDTSDDALWDRIQALPFLHELAAKGQEDLLGGKHLQDVMRDPQSLYLRGFLAWAMEGLERVRGGELFKAAEAVARATAAMREESDPYLEFWPWLISNADESNGEMPVLQSLLEGVTANWLKGQLEYWCDSNAVHFPRGRALKAVYEAVGLVKRASAQKWVLEHPERFPR